MNKELKDIAWAAIPPEARSEARREYAFHNRKGKYLGGDILHYIFGHHNLTSDIEPEEMVYVSKDKVLARYDECCSALQDGSLAPELRGYERGVNTVLRIFFPDTCLPPEPFEQKPTPKAIPDCDTCAFEHHGSCEIHIGCDGTPAWCDLNNEDAPCRDYKPRQTEQTMEEKKLNLLTLLKGAEGEKIYMPNRGEVKIISVNKDSLTVDAEDSYAIVLSIEALVVQPTGFAHIYPSKESFLASPLDAAECWQEWAESRKPRRDYGLKITWHSNYEDADCHDDRVLTGYTKTEIGELVDRIKATIQQFRKDHANLAEK